MSKPIAMNEVVQIETVEDDDVNDEVQKKFDALQKKFDTRVNEMFEQVDANPELFTKLLVQEGFNRDYIELKYAELRVGRARKLNETKIANVQRNLIAKYGPALFALGISVAFFTAVATFIIAHKR